MIPIYHYFLFAGTPDLSPWGIRRLKFMGHHALFHRDQHRTPIASGWIDEERVRRHLEPLDAGTPVFLNIEPIHGGLEWATLEITDKSKGKFKFRQRGMDLRLRLLEFCRQVNSNARYGYYKEPEGWSGLVLSPLTSVHYKDWQKYVRKVVPLLEAEDLIIPPFYFNRAAVGKAVGLEDGLLTCERELATLRYYSPLTPIWPVIWPQWYDLRRDDKVAGVGNTVESRDRVAMPGHVWRALWDYIMPRSDGLFLWGGAGFGGECGAPWDPAAPWWRVTQEVIARSK